MTEPPDQLLADQLKPEAELDVTAMVTREDVVVMVMSGSAPKGVGKVTAPVVLAPLVSAP
ncbi:hypothetical protein ACIRON_02670 [Nocardioides sp. NPDC101246]|uniref:hypothetical protein n=1 Tax=Nocardioides sp. NPDC101246 TaxID=3364336 RepID=UPI0038180D1A